jgi:hypothetical protein
MTTEWEQGEEESGPGDPPVEYQPESGAIPRDPQPEELDAAAERDPRDDL